MFYSVEEIRKKAFKIYNRGEVFRNFLKQGTLFPFEIKLKKIKQKDIQNNFTKIHKQIQELQAQKFHILSKDFRFKLLSTQKLPIAVLFYKEDELLTFLGKKAEFDRFVAVCRKTLKKFSQLESLIYQKPFLFLEYEAVLEKVFLVCDFFMEHPRPNIYLRELSIPGVDTKFVEQNKRVVDVFLTELLDENCYEKDVTKLTHYGFEKKYHLKYPLPLVRFRILDDTHKICALSDISVTIEEFKTLEIQVRNVFIVENKKTMLSFIDVKDSIVIFGGGYGVEVLKNVRWLRDKKIFYWGDIDSDGFAILSMLRGYFPDIKSIFMDKKTIEKFVEYSVSQEQAPVERVLNNLTTEEMKIYNSLRDGFRLEQERIHFDYIKDFLQNSYISQRSKTK